MPGGSLPPLSPAEEVRRRQLRRAKRRATSLLAAVTALFVASTAWGGESAWMGYVQATAAASMVGGLADWFAVTALFRHPLGLPIPHTAIVVERKDQFAATMGEFVQESFLTPDAIVGRLRSANVVGRLADWLAEPANAQRLAGEVVEAATTVASQLKDDDMHRAIEGIVRQRAEAVPLAPLAGQALRFATRGGRHDEVLDRALVGLRRYVDDNRHEIRGRMVRKSRWWVPSRLDETLFDRMLDGVSAFLGDMVDDPHHELRRELDFRLEKLASNLETSPQLRERGERIKRELLDQPQLQQFTAALWTDAKRQLQGQAADPDSQLRRRVASMISDMGGRLRSEPELAARAQRVAESLVRYVLERFRGEMAELVESTIARWNAAETATRLELLLGPDLQFVRINGTVVGGAAGLALHALADVLR